jgi:glycosyltransferase involved in cell wall biosynthesis
MLSQSFMPQQRVDLEKKLDDLHPDLDKEGKPRSLNLTSIVNNQIAVLTHSDYAKNAVKRKLLSKGTRVVQANLPVDVPIYPDIVRSETSRTTISFAGIIARVKGVNIVKDLVASQLFADCNVNIFGYSSVEPELQESLEALPHVNFVKSPSDHDFQALMADTDILVNVRLEYRGETSLTTVEGMRFGVITIVRRFGWYGELPEDTVVHVDDPADTLSAIRALLDDPAKMRATKKAAADYMRKEFTHRKYAQTMYDLMSD